MHSGMTIFVFLFNVIPVSAENEYYTVCSQAPMSCGNFSNIGYPFWGGNRPQFCGHPDFLLPCENNVPYFHLPTGGPGYFKPKILHMNTSSRTMLLVDEAFSFINNSCHDLTGNETLPNLSAPFKYSRLVGNISLFFDCETSVANYHHLHPFTCSKNNVSSSSSSSSEDLAYYSGKPSDFDSIDKSCQSRRTFPVLKSELDDLSKGNASILSVLYKGFEVEYMVNLNSCLACQNSGGICGSTDDSIAKFVCYCRHGSHPLVCPKLGRKLWIYLGSGISTILGIAIIMTFIALIICAKRRRRSTGKVAVPWKTGAKGNKNVEAFLKTYGSLVTKRYTYADIKIMTNSFRDKLGEGGYGTVYKGKLQDGRLVAVKKLKTMKRNGEDFINEVVSISRTNHVNVVTLLGFCSQGSKRALVYEFMPNGSLEKFICRAGNGQPLPQETMFDIAVGVAKGLDYLHRGCNARILHFDIKPHNILLDQDFCAKISDFGLAKLSVTNNSIVSMLEARGTIGYIAPEVFCRNFGGVSHKSDVYSYGMMVIDMAGGRKNLVTRNSSEVYFPDWIYDQLELEEEASVHGISDLDDRGLQRKMMLVGLWCIQTYPSNRPSMNRVVEMLEGSIESIQMPPKPDLSSPLRSPIASSKDLTLEIDP